MRALLLIGWVALWVASTAWAQDTDLQKLDRARSALKDKASSDAMIAIDPSKIDSIEVKVIQARTPGVHEGDPEAPITIYINSTDAAFSLILSAIKREAEVKAEKATRDLEATGISVGKSIDVVPLEDIAK